MATTTVAGSTVVFSNSGAAANLSQSLSEDSSSLEFTFDVLAASGGGAKTTIYSVDDGDNDGEVTGVTLNKAFSDYNTDLLAKDTAGIANAEFTDKGGKFWIGTDNKLHYDATNTDGVGQQLALGETVTDTFTYTIRMSNGTLSIGTITVTITGTNDAPVAVADVNAGDEDTIISGSVATNDSDVDNGAILTYSTTDVIAGLTFNEDGSYSLDAGDPAYQYLNAGESLDVVVNYTVTDEYGASDTATLTITINGVNDTVAVTLPPTYTGGGDPNDFDSLGDPADENLSGNNGNNVIYGGAGDDKINGNGGDDVIYAGSGNDDVNGNNHVDTLYGGSGKDVISGGNGDDVIIGGYDADTLTGNNGADTFRYLSLNDTNDSITDFESGIDKIDLSAIDANGAAAGDPAFTWGGVTIGAVLQANGVTWHVDGGNVVVLADTDGDLATAEFQITLVGITSVVAGDFIL